MRASLCVDMPTDSGVAGGSGSAARADRAKAKAATRVSIHRRTIVFTSVACCLCASRMVLALLWSRFTMALPFHFDIIALTERLVNDGLAWGAPLKFHFGDMVLDAERRELRSGTRLIAIEPLAFDLLEFLICHRDRVVGRDDLLAGVWGGRIVSDSAIGARINAARRAIGDDGEQQRWIRTIARKGFRFVGEAREEARSGTPSSPADAATRPVPIHASRGQEVAFCRTQDGVNLAVASVGQGLPLVRPSHWMTHVDTTGRAQSGHNSCISSPIASASFATIVETMVFPIGTSRMFPSKRSSRIW